MAEEHLKYLDYLQATMTRMAANSFVIKGWSVALGTAVLGFGVKGNDWRLAVVALLPTLCFWLLDGYYLGLERKFRALWDDAPKVAPPAGTAVSFKMNPGRLCAEQWGTAMCRPAVCLIHGAVLVTCVAAGSLLFVIQYVFAPSAH